jgi:hypothetical protein
MKKNILDIKQYLAILEICKILILSIVLIEKLFKILFKKIIITTLSINYSSILLIFKDSNNKSLI